MRAINSWQTGKDMNNAAIAMKSLWFTNASGAGEVAQCGMITSSCRLGETSSGSRTSE